MEGAPGGPLKNFNFFRGYIFLGALKPPQKGKIMEKNYWTLFITLKGILFRGGMIIFSRNKFLRDFLVRANVIYCNNNKYLHKYLTEGGFGGCSARNARV